MPLMLADNFLMQETMNGEVDRNHKQPTRFLTCIVVVHGSTIVHAASSPWVTGLEEKRMVELRRRRLDTSTD
jgi:hypothetical protein